jgi:hypothetical protein
MLPLIILRRDMSLEAVTGDATALHGNLMQTRIHILISSWIVIAITLPISFCLAVELISPEEPEDGVLGPLALMDGTVVNVKRESLNPIQKPRTLSLGAVGANN